MAPTSRDSFCMVYTLGQFYLKTVYVPAQHHRGEEQEGIKLNYRSPLKNKTALFSNRRHTMAKDLLSEQL